MCQVVYATSFLPIAGRLVMFNCPVKHSLSQEDETTPRLTAQLYSDHHIIITWSRSLDKLPDYRVKMRFLTKTQRSRQSKYSSISKRGSSSALDSNPSPTLHRDRTSSQDSTKDKVGPTSSVCSKHHTPPHSPYHDLQPQAPDSTMIFIYDVSCLLPIDFELAKCYRCVVIPWYSSCIALTLLNPCGVVWGVPMSESCVVLMPPLLLDWAGLIWFRLGLLLLSLQRTVWECWVILTRAPLGLFIPLGDNYCSHCKYWY